MPINLSIHTKATDAQREESILHLIAREVRIWMRAIVVASGVLTVILMMTVWPAAYITAAIALGAYILMEVASAMERRTRMGEELHQREHDNAEREALPVAVREQAAAAKDVPPHVVRRISLLAAIVVAVAAVIGLAMAFSIVDWPLVAIGAFVFFVYSILITWPVWLAWFEEDAEDHTPGDHLSIR